MLRVQKVLRQLNNKDIGLFGEHDAGGSSKYANDSLHYHPADEDDRDKLVTYWERKIDALKVLMQAKKHWTIPESRAFIESLPKASYINIAYYEKWMYAVLMLCLKKGIFSEKELLEKYHTHPQIIQLKNGKSKTDISKFKEGDIVQIRGVCSDEVKYESWRLYLGLIGKVHTRNPGYLIHKIGVVQNYQGLFENDELNALGIRDTKVAIYKIRFKQRDIFEDDSINENDHIDIDILSHWLQRVDEQKDAQHRSRKHVEQNAIDKEPTLSPYQVISEVVMNILFEKGIITREELRVFMERVDQAMKHGLGPKIVIKYWKDAKFRQQLMKEPDSVNVNTFLAKTFDAKYVAHDHMILKMMVNTEKTHNLIVCTLCSCYPRALLGIPPKWYKSLKYRAEAVKNPRRLLRNEFGCSIPDDMELNVYDSTSDLRYMVIPHLPTQIPNWEKMSNYELEKKITRDMLIGVKR